MITRRKFLPKLIDQFGLKIGAEIGVASGNYSAEILAGSASVQKLISIDAWAGDRGHDESQYLEACERLKPFGSRNELLRSDFESAATDLPRHSLDFAYIDGYAHTGNNSGNNFELFWPALRPGGLFGGHDYCRDFPRNMEAVDQFLRNHVDDIDGFWITDNDVFRSWFVWKRPRPSEQLVNLGLFNQDVVDGKNVAVVGNGPITQECKAMIDSADLVVRFNNWNCRSEYSSRISGKRCDLLFTHGDLREAGRSKGFEPPTTVVIAIPAPFKIDRLQTCIQTWWPDSQVVMVNPYFISDACRALQLESDGWSHPMPTVGFSFLYHLWRFPTNPDGSIYVTGFDWHIDQINGTAGRVCVKSNTMPSHFNHSYLRESKWCARNLIPNPRWSFSPIAEESLRFVRPWA